DRLILDRISLRVQAGEIVSLIGPNGAGKTTLLRLLLGLKPTREGQVLRRRGLRIGYMPQRFHTEPSLPLSVQRFMTLTRATAAAAGQALARTGATGLAGRALQSLSGGELQRVLLARALLCTPELLVLDEPAQGVD